MATSVTISLAVILVCFVLFQWVEEGHCYVVNRAETTDVGFNVAGATSTDDVSVGRRLTRSSCFSSQHGGPRSNLECLRRRIFNRFSGLQLPYE